MVINNVRQQIEGWDKEKIRILQLQPVPQQRSFCVPRQQHPSWASRKKGYAKLKEVVAQPEVLERVVERMNQQLQDRENL